MRDYTSPTPMVCKNTVQTFPGLHMFIGNMKRMKLGRNHSVAPKHLNDDVAEFVYLANRRWMEASLFDRLLVAAVTGNPMCHKELLTGDNSRFSSSECPHGFGSGAKILQNTLVMGATTPYNGDLSASGNG